MEQRWARLDREGKRKEIEKLKRVVESCQRKLARVTDPNYTPLSANGDQLLIAEIRKHEDEIQQLQKQL